MIRTLAVMGYVMAAMFALVGLVMALLSRRDGIEGLVMFVFVGLTAPSIVLLVRFLTETALMLVDLVDFITYKNSRSAD